MKRHPFLQTWWWKVVELTIVVVVLVYAVDFLARASISTTNVLLNDLRTDEPEQRAQQVFWSPWHKVEHPAPLIGPATEHSDQLRPGDVEQEQEWASYAEELRETTEPVARTLTFDLHDRSLKARYDLELAANHPLALALQRGRGQERPQAFVKELLGSIRVFDDRYLEVANLSFIGPYLKVEDPGSKVHVWLVAHQNDLPTRVEVSADLERPFLVAMPFAPDQITVRYPEGSQASVSGPGRVIRRDEQELIFERTDRDFPYYRVALTFPDSGERALREPSETREAEPRQRPTLVSVLRNSSINPPVLGSLIFALLESLPFLLFLRFVSEPGSNPSTKKLDDYRLIVGLFLVFHFSVYSLSSIRQLPALFDRLLGDTVLLDLDSFFPFLSGANVGQITVALVLAGYVWPRFVQRCTREHAIGLAPEKIPLLPLLTVAVLGVATIIVLSRLETLPLIWMLSAWCGIGVLVLLLSTTVLLNATLTRQRQGGRVVLATATMILLPVAGLLMYNQAYLPTLLIAGERTAFSWVLPAVVFLGAAMPLTLYTTEPMYRAFTDRSLHEHKTTWPRWARVALVLGVALFAYPTRWLLGGEATVANWRDIFELAHLLDDLIRYSFLGILLEILRRESEASKGAEITTMARNVGIILALTFFYSPTIRWLYIPIVFLLGYVMLSRWLLVGNATLDKVGDQIIARRHEIIQAIVAQNHARRALSQMNYALAKKAEDSNFDFKAHDDKVRALEKSIRTAESRDPLRIAGVPTANLVLAVSSSTSNWENGKKSALYSIFFALPWIILYFRDLAVNPNLSESYIVLYSLLASMAFLVRWSLYGFFFGYFFAVIRGCNGLQKGLAYFVSLVVPQLAFAIVIVGAGKSNWIEFGVWALQIFSQTMLLGLIAGDYDSLRRSRLGWSQLFEVHNFSALASWASSTALAVGTAISALLASYGTDLVRAVLQVGGMAAPDLGSSE